MNLQVDFGGPQTSIGYRFYDILGAWVGSRQTSNILNAPQSGVYIINVTPPNNSVGIYWDCADPSVTASELIDILTSDENAQLDYIASQVGLLSPNNITLLSPVSIEEQSITARIGDQWNLSLLGLGNLNIVSNIWFTVKLMNKQSLDSLAILFVDKSTGLTVVNSTVFVDTTKGSIAIADSANGDINIYLDESITTLLTHYADYKCEWAVKVIDSNNKVTTLATGPFKFQHQVISAIS